MYTLIGWGGIQLLLAVLGIGFLKKVLVFIKYVIEDTATTKEMFQFVRKDFNILIPVKMNAN